MSEPQRFVFPFGRAPERLDRYLAESLPEQTRAQLKRLIDEGRVLLDDSRVKAGCRLKGGEVVVVDIPDPTPMETCPENIPLDILFEDEHLVVIDKPAGMVVHPAPGHDSGTLVNALLHHCGDLAGIGGVLRPGIVHRLDKDTSGVMVATKNDAAHQAMAGQFKRHSIRRQYLALVHGLVEAETGTVDQPIGRHPVDRKKMSGRSRQGRRAVTRWKVLQRFDQDRLTWLRLTLETGRTHQIRVHFAEMNHPLVGDPVYGSSKKTGTIKDIELRKLVETLARQALHARLLGFEHPAKGEYLEFRSEPPEDLQRILSYLAEKYRV